MDGTSGSTTFVDQKGNAVTASNAAKVSTSSSKFGGASGLFYDAAGSQNYLTIGGTSALPTGTESFTIEFWMNSLSAYSAGGQFLLQNSAMGGLQIGQSPSGTLRLGAAGVSAVVEYNLSSFSPVTWYHVAFVRSGSSFKLFVNGANVASATNTLSFAANTVQTVGGAPGAPSFPGYLDDLRVTRGVARYNLSATVPTAAFPNQ